MQNPSKVIFPLHGIRTRAAWQKALVEIAQRAGWVVRLDQWSFGYFSVLRFLLPSQRKGKVEWFNKTYQREINSKDVDVDDERPPSIVVHSFGSYILGNALLKYETLKFNKVILCGSILPRDFPWDELLSSGQIQAVRNEYGVRDRWSRIVRWFVSGTGSSGVLGFTAIHARFEQQHYAHFSHSDYFDKEHMRRNWLPFIETELISWPASSRPSVWWKPKSITPWGLYGIYILFMLSISIMGALIYSPTSAPLRARLYLRFHRRADTEAMRERIGEDILTRQGPQGGIEAERSGQNEQAWTTAQALCGLLSSDTMAESHAAQLHNGFKFLEKIKKSEGEAGAGWGLFPESPYSLSEINAWVELAYIQSLKRSAFWKAEEKQSVLSSTSARLKELADRQTPSGGWTPIIGDLLEDGPRTYSTELAVWALADAHSVPGLNASRFDDRLRNGVDWLLVHRDASAGWIPNPSHPEGRRIPGLDAQVFFVLSRVASLKNFQWIRDHPAFQSALRQILDDSSLVNRPLIVNETLSPGDQFIKFRTNDGVQVFDLEGSTFLWYPWLLAANAEILQGKDHVSVDMPCVLANSEKLLARINKEDGVVGTSELYVPSETIIGIAEYSQSIYPRGTMQ